jgi:hypothetical protein
VSKTEQSGFDAKLKVLGTEQSATNTGTQSEESGAIRNQHKTSSIGHRVICGGAGLRVEHGAIRDSIRGRKVSEYGAIRRPAWRAKRRARSNPRAAWERDASSKEQSESDGKRQAPRMEQFVGGAEFQVLNTEQSVARGDPRTSTGTRRRERSNLQATQGAK